LTLHFSFSLVACLVALYFPFFSFDSEVFRIDRPIAHDHPCRSMVFTTPRIELVPPVSHIRAWQPHRSPPVCGWPGISGLSPPPPSSCFAYFTDFSCLITVYLPPPPFFQSLVSDVCLFSKGAPDSSWVYFFPSTSTSIVFFPLMHWARLPLVTRWSWCPIPPTNPSCFLLSKPGFPYFARKDWVSLQKTLFRFPTLRSRLVLPSCVAMRMSVTSFQYPPFSLFSRVEKVSLFFNPSVLCLIPSSNSIFTAT